MADPVIVLLVLLAADAQDPATQAVAAAARRAIGQDGVVLVQETDTLPQDEDALALGRTVHAASVAEIVWENTARSRVRLHVYVPERASWSDRELVFETWDAPGERGRALGLTLATVLGQAREEAAIMVETPVPPAEAPPPPVVAPPELTAPRGASPPPDAAPPPPRARRRFLAIDGTAIAGTGIGGSALGAGPSIAARVYVLDDLALRGVGAIRFGSLDTAAASSTTTALGGGVSFRALRTSGVWPLELGVRADLLAVEQLVAREALGSTLRRSRWITAADVYVEGAWRLGEPISLVAAVGAEVAFGSTDVTVGGQSVAHIPPGRVLVELGVRVHF